MVPAPRMPVLQAALQNSDSDSPRSLATHCRFPPPPRSNDTAWERKDIREAGPSQVPLFREAGKEK